jgi:hypothetical protein
LLPMTFSIFLNIPQSSENYGTDSYVTVLNRFTPVSAGQRSKIRGKYKLVASPA